MKTSHLIEKNITYIFRNALCFYFWDEKPVKETINKAKNRFKTELLAEKDLDSDGIDRLFDSYIEKAKNDCFFIVKKEIENSIYPKIRNFRDFKENNELPFSNLGDMQNFINNNF